MRVITENGRPGVQFRARQIRAFGRFIEGKVEDNRVGDELGRRDWGTLERVSDTAEIAIERCPMCRYRLEGLPGVRGICPECGTLYDRRWRIFGGHKQHLREGRDRVLITIAIATFALVLFNMVRTSGFYGVSIVVIATLPFLAMTVFRQPAGFIAIGDDGVVVVSKARQFAEYTWPKLSGARMGRGNDHLHLILRADPELDLRTWTFFHTNYKEAQACVDAINAECRERILGDPFGASEA